MSTAAGESCSFDGCTRPPYAKGWCKSHYNSVLKHGTPTKARPAHPEVCTVEGCGRPFYCKEFCVMHYARFRSHGDPLVDKTRQRGICTISGCDKLARTKDLCGPHYMKAWRHGHPEYEALPKERPICTIDGCEREQYAKGWCKGHYNRSRKYNDPSAGGKTPEPYDKMAKCAVEGCDNLIYNSRGWCHTHYETWRRRDHAGDPGEPALAHTVEQMIERYFDRSGGPDACHPCTLAASPDGYVRWHGQSVHRAVWEATHGPIPEGMTVSHDCHDRASHAGLCEGGFSCLHRRCGNVVHYSLMTLADNIRASGSTPAARGRARTHCVNGHELTEDNVYRSGINSRQCRTCALDRSRQQPPRTEHRPR